MDFINNLHQKLVLRKCYLMAQLKYKVLVKLHLTRMACVNEKGLISIIPLFYIWFTKAYQNRLHKYFELTIRCEQKIFF